MTEPILRLQEVGRSYGNTPVTHALRSLNLSIYPGEFVAIVGPSGAGKSTLLNILGLLDHPTSGKYFIDGTDTSSLKERHKNQLRARTFGFVFQASHIMPDLAAVDNAALGLKIQSIDKLERIARVTKALGLVGLLTKSAVQGKNLSGGERQRIAIARAIATEPKIILADEPTGALDTANGVKIIEHLRELNNSGATVLIITHDLNIAAAADRQVVLRDGKNEDGHNTGQEPYAVFSDNLEDSRQLFMSGQPKKNKPKLTSLWPWVQRLGEEVTDAISSHTSRPARALVLIVAFLLGAGGLVGSLGLTQSAAAQVSDRLTQAALDEVIVYGEEKSELDSGIFAVDSDAKQSIERLDGVLGVGLRVPLTTSNAVISRLPRDSVQEQKLFEGPRLFADASYLGIQGVQTEPAHAAELLNNNFGAYAAIVGRNAAKQLGISSFGEGQTVWMNGYLVTVAGVIQDAPGEKKLLDSIVLSRNLSFTVRGTVPTYVVRTIEGYPAPLADAIPLALNPGSPGNVHLSTVADLRDLRRGVSNDLGVFVAVISCVLLVLACLSAAVAMYLSVASRAAEIALRRALGASRASIWRMFTLEGATIGVAGGVAGSAVGMASIIIVCAVQSWTPVLNSNFIWVGIIAGGLTGVLSATYPAIVAAQANPADAIRG